MTTKYQPGVRVGEYVLEECVGAGTFGEVWRARHHVWAAERVAVKLPTEPQYVRYLQREGIVVHGLNHPCIVRVIGFDPYADIPYLVMELVDGPSLRAVIEEHPKGLPLEVVPKVLCGMLHAMAEAHEHNIIHRDLKPGNVLLNLRGRHLSKLEQFDVKVTDFGLGVGDAETFRNMVLQSGSIERDRAGATIAGTLAYLAPEVRDGHQPPSPRSDLYSIGVILFEMLTGARPAGAELPSSLRAEVPPGLDECYRRLYALFENRYESATAALRDLTKRLRDWPPRDWCGASYEGGDDDEPGDDKANTGSAKGAKATTIEPGPVRCPHCQSEPLGPYDQFCMYCGKQLVETVLRCPTCGGYPGRDDRFCIFCGTVLPAREG